MFPQDFRIWKFCYLYSEKLSHVTEFRNQTAITAIKMTDDTQMFNDERLTPHRAVHPGEILREELRERGISTDDFARRLGMSSRNLHNFLRGDLPLSKDLAQKLEEHLAIPAPMWLRLYEGFLRNVFMRSRV